VKISSNSRRKKLRTKKQKKKQRTAAFSSEDLSGGFPSGETASGNQDCVAKPGKDLPLPLQPLLELL
jgi:hypothetical protein